VISAFPTPNKYWSPVVARAIIVSTSLFSSKSAILRARVNAVALPNSEVKNNKEKSNERKERLGAP
jgi:hypothetical protein